MKSSRRTIKQTKYSKFNRGSSGFFWFVLCRMEVYKYSPRLVGNQGLYIIEKNKCLLVLFLLQKQWYLMRRRNGIGGGGTCSCFFGGMLIMTIGNQNLRFVWWKHFENNYIQQAYPQMKLKLIQQIILYLLIIKG